MTNQELLNELKTNAYVEVDGPQMCRPLHGITNVWARKRGSNLIELRMGFTFPGTSDESRLEENPFYSDYKYNYVTGIGKTLEAAWESLKRVTKEIADGYWV